MSEFTKKTLERIRSSSGSEPHAKKRRISRIILLIDIIIVIVIIMVYNRNAVDTQYYSNTVKYNNINYLISLTREKQTGNFIYSFTAASELSGAIRERYTGAIANLDIGYGDNIFYETRVGENVNKIVLQPGETKTFVKKISSSVFSKYAKNHPQNIIPEEKTLIMFEDQYIPLYIITTINSGNGLSTRLEFKYKVE